MKATKILGVFALALLLFGWGLTRALAQDNATRDGSAEFFPCLGTSVSLGFDDAGDAFVFNLTPFANGTAKVSTDDCCLSGPDIWRAELHQVGAGKTGKSKAGNGAIGNFTGTVSKGVQVGKQYQAIISADSIPAGFPAGMDVCFTGPVIVVGPLAE